MPSPKCNVAAVECARYFTCRYLPGMHAQACPLWHSASDEDAPPVERGKILLCWFDARRGQEARARLRELVEAKGWREYLLIPSGSPLTRYEIVATQRVAVCFARDCANPAAPSAHGGTLAYCRECAIARGGTGGA